MLETTANVGTTVTLTTRNFKAKRGLFLYRSEAHVPRLHNEMNKLPLQHLFSSLLKDLTVNRWKLLYQLDVNLPINK